MAERCRWTRSKPALYLREPGRAEANGAILVFVDFYLGDGIDAVTDVGYVALEDGELQETIDAWQARQTGSREG